MSGGGSGSIPGLTTDTTLSDLEAAWKEREAEASLLANAGHFGVALASRLYALEIRIKVRICKHLGLILLPKHCKTHDLDELVLFTGLWPVLDDPANTTLRQNWELLSNYSRQGLNQLRYKSNTQLDAAQRDRLFQALDDRPEGVWTWLSSLP